MTRLAREISQIGGQDMGPDFPLKEKTDLCFCNICILSDLSLKDWRKILEKIMNIRVDNILQYVTKEESLNSKKLDVITRSRAGQEGIPRIKETI